MSDISGPPVPKIVDPASRVNERAGTVSKDPQRSETQSRDQASEKNTRNNETDPLRGREPAVSISASAAHLEVGERLKEKINKIDLEGRPIIVTETATFALRPDAGIRAGDDVELEIVEAGKKLAADLLMKNDRPIDPPIRLQLVVIAIHAPREDQLDPTGLVAGKVSYGPAARPPTTTITQSETQASDALYSLVAGRTNPGALPLNPQQNQPADDRPSFGAYTVPLANQPSTLPPPQFADNPDKAGARSNSSDLATLIAAQQGQQPKRAVYPWAQQTPPQTVPNDPSHFIPKSPLTEIQGAPSTVGPNEGLGPALAAFTLDGAARQIQVMDPMVSKVSPREVADVFSVTPLSPDDAKGLPIAMSALSAATASLARVETSQGSLVMSLSTAANLAGEQIRISEAESKSPPMLPGHTYTAKLFPPNQATPQPVTVSLPDKDQIVAGVPAATIKAVHMARAYLAADGPKNDLRLETSRGLVMITLPNDVRPAVGDPLQMIPLQAKEGPALAPLGQTVPPLPLTPTGAVVPDASMMGALSSSAWPALQQSMTLLAGTDPAAAAALATRSADGGGKLTNSLLFFLAATGKGSPESWLGTEAERALETHNRSLLDSLKRDIAHLMGTAKDTGSEWRQILLPLDLRAPDMPLIAMLFHQGQHVDPDKDQAGQNQTGKDDDDPQRFVLEVQFTVFGKVQLDGVIKGSTFDLTLRSLTALPGTLRHDAIQLFDSALAASAFTGRLMIVEQQPFPVDVAAIMAAG